MANFASLKGKASFAAVFRRGRKFRSELFRLYILKRDGDVVRAGISVTRRACNAAKRNLIRRRLRQLISIAVRDWAVGADVVVYVEKDISAAGFEFLKSEIERALTA